MTEFAGGRFVRAALLAALVCATACAQQPSKQRLAGAVKIDGSSTVAPIMTAAAELFRGEQPRVNVTVGTSGTGGGFKKFLEQRAELRIDISDASRPISASEKSSAAQLAIEFLELPIALDGIAVVISKQNDFVDHLTVDELKRIWEPESKINNWNQVRPGFPDLPLKLYGPGTDSGTFDFFTEAIVGKARASRNDYSASENDNVLVQGVSGDRGGLGYFGFSYYEANTDKLKVVPIAEKDGKPVSPSRETIHDGSYQPLARPLFIYVNAAAAERPEVQAFLEFYFKNAKAIVEHPKVQCVALDGDLYASIVQRFRDRVKGSAFDTPHATPGDLSAKFGKPVKE